jgi:hypothetical protein
MHAKTPEISRKDAKRNFKQKLAKETKVKRADTD